MRLGEAETCRSRRGAMVERGRMDLRLYRRASVLVVAGLALLTAYAPALSDPAAGRVFVDTNGNGRLDPGEKGLAGVPVTDGLTVVRTDTEGRYALDAKIDAALLADTRAILTVTFPSGYWPTAGWMRRLSDAADTAAIHFALRTEEQRLPFVFIHGSDPHIPRGGAALFPRFRDEVRDLAGPPRFCILTGDMVDASDRMSRTYGLRDYRLVDQGVRGFPVPLFCLPGNHDLAGSLARSLWDPKDPLYLYGMHWKFVGPLRWSFNYGGYHFVGVDFMDRDRTAWRMRAPATAMAWLKADLDLVPKDTPVLFFIHYPLGPPELLPLLREHGVRQVFAGHTHTDAAFVQNGVPVLLSGSISQTGGDRLPGYRLVLVGEKGIETFYKATGDPHAVTLDWPREKDVLGSRPTIRGAFLDSAGEVDRLTVRVGDVERPVEFRRTPICCRFEAPLDLTSLAPGPHPLAVVLSGGGKDWRFQRTVRVDPARNLTTTSRAAS